MQLVSLLSIGTLLYGAASATTNSSTSVDEEMAAALTELANLTSEAQTADYASVSSANATACTKDNIQVRKEWGSMDISQRKGFADAILCLQSLPPKTPNGTAGGIRSRYDDFVWTHINQTNSIHFTGNFLVWHRWFIHSFFSALKTECGYDGVYPYWNWGLWADDLEQSPIFDGGEYSMGGNGEYIPDLGTRELTANAIVVLPNGTGGGCVYSGPFANMTVNLEVVALVGYNGTTILGDGSSYDPRCLKRDISSALAMRYSNASSTMTLLSQPDMASFLLSMSGNGQGDELGVHGGGHYSIGGDPAMDLYVSPAEPAFWLHHGMIDLTWWAWQSMDPATRQNALSGTNTMFNTPPSANTTLDDVVDLYYAGGGPMTIRDLMSTTQGPFCYTYEP